MNFVTNVENVKYDYTQRISKVVLITSLTENQCRNEQENLRKLMTPNDAYCLDSKAKIKINR
jgi:hypothetical protein